MSAHVISRPPRSAFGRFAGFVSTIAAILAETGEMMRCARDAERLLHLSDAELARRGLRPDTVVRHAFRRFLPA